jgi:hypothetical protein
MSPNKPGEWATFNCSAAFKGLVFSTGRAVARAAVASARGSSGPVVTKRWNYESTVKLAPRRSVASDHTPALAPALEGAGGGTGGAGGNGGGRVAGGSGRAWNASGAFKGLVFSGHSAKPLRPAPQAFPHGRTLGFSTLQLV